jgi:hypothetical protein
VSIEPDQSGKLIDTAGHWLTTQTDLDVLGRIMQKQLTSDPSGVDYVDIRYDALNKPGTDGINRGQTGRSPICSKPETRQQT